MGRGGQLRTKSRLQKVLLGSSGDVEGFQLADGSTVTGDLYVSAMPGTALCTLRNTGMPACYVFFRLPQLAVIEGYHRGFDKGLLRGSTGTYVPRMP